MSSDTAYLALLLDGPLQSWGFASRFQRRTTGLHPTKSGVVGLICAAMGLAKGSPEEHVTLPDLADAEDDQRRHPARGAALGRGRAAGAPSGGLPHRARHASRQRSDEQGRRRHPPRSTCWMPASASSWKATAPCWSEWPPRCKTRSGACGSAARAVSRLARFSSDCANPRTRLGRRSSECAG